MRAPDLDRLGEAAAPASTVPRLAARGVHLTLGDRIVLDGIGFEVCAGEIYGLLGPNGSGKTSLMRCLMGLVRPDLGVFWLDGQELGMRQRHLRARLGCIFQQESLDSQLTARENLLLAAALYRVPRAAAASRAQELLEFMELAEQSGDPVKTLSGGMRRRLEIARALIHRPELLLMDEPTTGLDPQAFERVWQLLLALRRLHGLTIVLTTHKAEEAARCDRLLVLDRGHVVIEDTPAGLLARLGGEILIIDASAAAELAEILRRDLRLCAEATEDEQVTVVGEELHLLVPRLVAAFPSGRMRAIAMRRPDLADAFLKITGRPLGELELAGGAAGRARGRSP